MMEKLGGSEASAYEASQIALMSRAAAKAQSISPTAELLSVLWLWARVLVFLEILFCLPLHSHSATLFAQKNRCHWPQRQRNASKTCSISGVHLNQSHTPRWWLITDMGAPIKYLPCQAELWKKGHKATRMLLVHGPILSVKEVPGLPGQFFSHSL